MSLLGRLARVELPSETPSTNDSSGGVTREAVTLGQTIATPSGPLTHIQKDFDTNTTFGRIELKRFETLESESVAEWSLSPSFRGIDLKKALFLDTETTGLSGSAGTIPFLTGMSFWTDKGWQTEQLFVPDFGLEVPVLERLRSRLNAARLVVSYNGKSFDWPLLKNRFVLNRLTPPAEMPHLDLLHCARRLLKARLGSVRLVNVEREILGFHRKDDVEGALIPELYFDYLETGDLGPMKSVLTHNEWDLLAMPALMVALDDIYRGAGSEQALDWSGALKVAQRADAADHAHHLALKIVASDRAPLATIEACIHLAAEAKKGHDLRREEEWLIKAMSVATGSRRGARPAFRLAILYEHGLRQYADALHYARLAAPVEGPVAHRKRIVRLLRKIRASQGA